MLDDGMPGMLLDMLIPGDTLAGPDVGLLDENPTDDDWLTIVAMPLEEPGPPPNEELGMPGLLYDGNPPGVEETPAVLVYWLGGETTAELERLGLIIEDTLPVELPSP